MKLAEASLSPHSPAWSWIVAASLLSLATAGSYVFDQHFTSQALLYVLAVVLASYALNWVASVAFGVAAVTVFYFVFVPQRWAFVIETREHLFSLATMLLVALVISQFAGALRRETRIARLNEKRARQLQVLASGLAGAGAVRDAMKLGQEALDAAFGGPCVLVRLLADGKLEWTGGATPGLEDDLRGCMREAALLGPGTGRESSLHARFLPLLDHGRVIGAASIPDAAAEHARRREHAQAVCALLAQAMSRLQATAAMHAAQDETQRQQVQSTFLAAISHDLRTPLAAVVAAASSLQTQGEKLGAAERTRLLECIVGEATHLSTVTENTLQLVRLTNAAQELRRDWESIEEVVGAVLARVRQRDPARRIKSSVPPDLPLIRADPVLLGQLIGNLLDNALKYSADAVELAVDAVEGEMRVSVLDRGPGIPEAEHATIFEPYARGDQSGRRRGAGSGGMPGDRRGARRPHGPVPAQRRRELVQAVAAPGPAPARTGPAMKLRVLVVEDDREIRAVLKSSLSVEGFAVQTAVSSSEARALLRHATPDVMLLDLGLPDGDGVELVHEARQKHAFPILVVSARHQEEQKILLLDAGADDYLVKPFSVAELLARIRVALRHRGTALPVAITTHEFEDLRIDVAARLVQCRGAEVRLTPTEFKLIARLVRDAGRVVTHRQLLAEVWGPEFVEHTHYLRLYMGQLRAKIELDPAEPRYLLTEAGVGYRLASS